VFAGEVGAASRQEYTVMGNAVNLSARIMAYSSPGQLLIDQTTYDHSQGSLQFDEATYVQFKGMKEPMAVYEVLGLKIEERPMFSDQRKPLIGRADEMDQIEDIINEVVDGQSRTVVIQSKPGVGKTRLAQEVLDIVKGNELVLAAGEALSYAEGSPHLIWISILRKLMGLPAAGGGKGVLEQLNRIVAKADPEHSFRTPIIAAVLGIESPENDITRHFDTQLRQENLFDFMVEYLQYLTKESPLLLYFEDCQWIDKKSIELLTYLMRCSEDMPILFLMTKRLATRAEINKFVQEILDSEMTTSLVLSELTVAETEQMTLNELGADIIDPDLMKFIYDASRGNASFTEQFIATMRSQDKIRLMPDVETKKQKAVPEGDLSKVEVPDSLSSLIMSQLDRLGPEAGITVKVASVIGSQFEEEVLTSSYPVEMTYEMIKSSIDELQKREIIEYTADNDLYDYIFKNLLTQDVAYDSLLFAHRREYHRRIGVVLEDLHTDFLKEWYEELARHFYMSDDSRRAILYLGKSGDKAFNIFANESAEDFYTRSLDRASEETYLSERYQLLQMRSMVFAIIGKVELLKLDLESMLDIAQQLSDTIKQVNTLDDLARYYYRINDLDEMKRTIDQAREILQEMDYPFGEINIDSKEGTWHFLQNQYAEALKFWTRSKDRAEEINDEKGITPALTNCAMAYKALGNFDRAIEYYNLSIDYSRNISDRKSEAVNLGNLGVLYYRQGEVDRALGLYEEALEIARSIGSKQITLYYLGNLATIYKAKGQRKQALTTQEELLRISKQAAYQVGMRQALTNIGTWHLENGDFEKALSYYKQSLDMTRKNKERGKEPLVLLNMGLTYHYLGELDRARETLEQAVKLAVKGNSKPVEEYARRYLGFVLIDQGEMELALKEFKKALKIAIARGAKAEIASSKIGIGSTYGTLTPEIKGTRRSRKRSGAELIEEGIAQASKIGNVEVIIKGRVMLARLLMEYGSELLESALDLAQESGQYCDVPTIEALLRKLSD
ncbi:MAG: tetratricopeptide repeat protein, partial [Candidatus Electryoneaceae bacterium]|nr:tetratricopeptide repeat protein [Candidatus Electryoneaceae bacterium]